MLVVYSKMRIALTLFVPLMVSHHLLEDVLSPLPRESFAWVRSIDHIIGIHLITMYFLTFPCLPDDGKLN